MTMVMTMMMAKGYDGYDGKGDDNDCDGTMIMRKMATMKKYFWT